ncbi:hypothetical protein GGI04_002236 [Coemansia thaxteri]|nr:hypothetical protein GGI04_002236 [Coemansia thaxteri]KAJ2470758.1 hypothetical protein GGI02_002717 [Coemansia sp. RSA 2322]
MDKADARRRELEKETAMLKLKLDEKEDILRQMDTHLQLKEGSLQERVAAVDSLGTVLSLLEPKCQDLEAEVADLKAVPQSTEDRVRAEAEEIAETILRLHERGLDFPEKEQIMEDTLREKEDALQAMSGMLMEQDQALQQRDPAIKTLRRKLYNEKLKGGNLEAQLEKQLERISSIKHKLCAKQIATDELSKTIQHLTRALQTAKDSKGFAVRELEKGIGQVKITNS